MSVDWEAVEDRLPLGQDPNSRAARKAAFARMDPSGNGKLSLTELQSGLPNLIDDDNRRAAGEAATSLVPMIKDFRPAIKCAFQVARDLAPKKRKRGRRGGRRGAADTNIDPTEFHAVLIAFREYLELFVVFKELDDGFSEDNYLSYKECEKGLDMLAAWDIDRSDLKLRFKGDQWAGTMKFAQFADWCLLHSGRCLNLELDESDSEVVQVERAAYEVREAAGCEEGNDLYGKELEDEQNKRKVMEVFNEWDTDQNGTISLEELSAVLSALNPDWTQDQIDRIFAAADTTGEGGGPDGKLNRDEFFAWLFK